MNSPVESSPGGSSKAPEAQSAAGPDALIGVTISGRYRIEKLLGEGGMGAVYQAEHTLMHKRVAIKVLHAEMSRMPEVVARFEREAMAASHIDHPNVAIASDFGKLDDGSFFLVLEFVEGESLREVIGRGPLKWRRALHIVRQVVGGLVRAHGLGIVHRDLKPENVMLVLRDGDPDFVKVLDFGIAKVPVGDMSPGSKRGPALTQVGMVYGTPEYMAPEQALGQEVDARADLYSVGVMLYEMLAGMRPYESESRVTLLGMHVTAPIPAVADKAPDVIVPADVEGLIGTLLAKEATQRCASAKDLLDAIGAVLGKPTLPPPGPRRPMDAVLTRVDVLLARAETVLPLDRLPLQTTRRNKLYVLGAVGAAILFASGLGFAVALRTAFGGGAATVASATSSSSPSSPTSPTAEPAPKLSPVQVSELDQRAQNGHAAAAIPVLEAFVKLHPERADVHRALLHAYVATSDAAAILREAIAWVAVDAHGFAADEGIVPALRATALDKNVQDQAFEAFESKLDAVGPDVLWELAHGAAPAAPQAVQARARKSLAKPDVRRKASPALAVTLALKNTANICEARAELFPEARRIGDLRTLVVLSPYQRQSGCGFLKLADCWPCLRGGGESLTKTMAEIRARTSK